MPTDRQSAIVSHPEAAGRTGLARHLAFSTDMSVEQAVGVLRASARDVNEAAATAGAVTARALLGLRADAEADARIGRDIAARQAACTLEAARQDGDTAQDRAAFAEGRRSAAGLLGKRLH